MIRATRFEHCLLVEDDEIDQEMARRAFADVGCERLELHVASDGIEALEMLRKQPRWRWVVILDLKLPRMNGLELLQALRGDPETRQVPVFVLTTSVNSADLRRAHASGIVGYFAKPNDPAALREIVSMVATYCRYAEPPEG